MKIFWDRLKMVASKRTGIDLLYGLLGVVIYFTIPTVFKLKGTLGALVGWGSSVVTSTLLGRPAIAIGGTITFAAHAVYIYINPIVFQSTGRAIFGWSEDNYTATTTTDTTTNQTAPGALNDRSVLTLPNGQKVVGYLKQDGLEAQPTVRPGQEVTLRDKPTTRPGSDMVIRAGSNPLRKITG